MRRGYRLLVPLFAMLALVGLATPASAATVDAFWYGNGSCSTFSYGDTSSYGYNWSVISQTSGSCNDLATKALYSDASGWHWGVPSHGTAAIGGPAGSSSYVGRRVWQAWPGGDKCWEDTIYTAPYLLPDQANWAACMSF